MDGPDLTEPRRRPKLSEVVAERIRAEIADRAWPVGRLIGTEAELMTRFGVSRGTLSEAIRQVERHGLAQMRRGGGGGLVVSGSALNSTARAIATYLELCGVTIDEHYEACRVLELQALQLAARRLSEGDCAELRALAAGLDQGEMGTFLRRSVALRFRIADLSGNAALGLFVRAMARIVTHYVRPDLHPAAADGDWRRRMTGDLRDLVEAVVAGDVATGQRLALSEIGRRERAARQMSAGRPVLTPGALRPDTPQKRGEQLAFEIMSEIAAHGWPAGHRIGDEAGLQKHFNVSPWIFRQAVRILEPHGVIQTKRGRAGGLFVGAPSPDYTIECAATFLRSTPSRPADLFAGYAGLMAVVAQRVAGRLTQADRAAFAAAEAPAAGGPAHDPRLLQAWLLDASRNPTLALFGAILHRLLANQAASGASPALREAAAAVRLAVLEGDAALARRRAPRYLGLLYPGLAEPVA